MLKNWLGESLENPHAKSFVYTQIFIAVVTVISIVSIILESVESLSNHGNTFTAIEWLAVSIFTVEYISRIAISNKKLAYIFSFWGLLDFITIAPTFLALGNFSVLRAARVLRIMRLLRVFRLAKITRAYIQTHNEFQTKAELAKVNAVIYFIALLSSIVAFGAALYAVEGHQYNYSNIPLAMIESSKILLGGLGQTPASTTAGEIVILLGRLVGLALFGLLISVVGNGLNRLLFGKDEEKDK